jgi:ribonuclease T1
MLRNGFELCRRFGATAWLVVCLGLVGFGPIVVHARGPQENPVASISADQLPPQARDMLTLIYQGGPFRYDKDGTVFGNRERILPARNRGYYREYTVRTRGERTRGARRIICGGVKPATPDACYYTDDHYASFRQIERPAGH